MADLLGSAAAPAAPATPAAPAPAASSTASIAPPLQSVSILEQDVTGEVLIAWSFPAVPKALHPVLKSRAGLGDPAGDASPFRFSKFKTFWLYHLTAPVSHAASPKVKAVSLCVCSLTFNPAKYHALLAIMVKSYVESFEPVTVMQHYLSVFTRGRVESKHGVFEEAKFDDRRAYISQVKSLFDLFGQQTILIWAAMLCKKRVFVYADTVADLLTTVRSFPLLGAWHRMDWSLLRPLMAPTEVELADLRAQGVYVAGFTDASASSQVDYYDVFCDVSSGSVTVAEHAKANFVTTKIHKDMLEQLMEAAQSSNDQALIKIIALKTNEIIAKLKSLVAQVGDGKSITLEQLSTVKLPPNADRFLYGVAVAERLAKA